MKIEQEPDRINTRRVHRAAIVGLVGLAAGIVAALLLLRGTPAPTANPPFDASSLIVASEPGMTLKSERRDSLDHYGWVDRDAGIAKIPIERAIDLVAADAGH